MEQKGSGYGSVRGKKKNPFLAYRRVCGDFFRGRFMRMAESWNCQWEIHTYIQRRRNCVGTGEKRVKVTMLVSGGIFSAMEKR